MRPIFRPELVNDPFAAAEGRRTAPSAGALYPLELHVVAARVEGLGPGVYRYIPDSHKLRPAIAGTIVPALSRAAFFQQAVADAAAVVVIAAVEERTAHKYGGRASRYVRSRRVPRPRTWLCRQLREAAIAPKHESSHGSDDS